MNKGYFLLFPCCCILAKIINFGFHIKFWHCP